MPRLGLFLALTVSSLQRSGFVKALRFSGGRNERDNGQGHAYETCEPVVEHTGAYGPSHGRRS
jgi:hypothetical protein